MRLRDLLSLMEKQQNLSIVNIDDMTKVINSYAARTTKLEVIQWFNSVVKNYLRQSARDNLPILPTYAANYDLPDWAEISLEKNQDINFFKISAQTKETLNRIFDFLQSDAASKLLPKLQRITVDQMLTLEKQWLEKLSKEKTEKLDASHYKLIYAFADEFKIVQLLTPECKGEEGSLMGHCVGGSTYEKKTIFSLRDKQNQPHATMEVDGKNIVQLQGKQNQEIVEKYWPYIKEFISKTGYNVELHYLRKIGLIAINGEIYDINELPDNLTVNGGLDLHNSKLTSLPNNLTVNGLLDIRSTKISSLPKNLSVSDDLYIQRTDITTLPADLVVGGNLDLASTNVTSLPHNLTIGGYLDAGNGLIDSLPNNLSVGGRLYLKDSNITSLPNNLSVGGSLYLTDTNITALPDNLSIGGYLDIKGTNITELPNDLIVGERIRANEGQLKKVPTKFKDKIAIS